MLLRHLQRSKYLNKLREDLLEIVGLFYVKELVKITPKFFLYLLINLKIDNYDKIVFTKQRGS